MTEKLKRESSTAWVAGTGFVTAAGLGLDSFSQRVFNDQTMLANEVDDSFVGSVPIEIISEIEELEAERVAKFRDQTDGRLFPAHCLLASAIGQALQSAGISELTAEDGLILATTTGQVATWENDLMQYLLNRIDEEKLNQSFRYESLGVSLNQVRRVLGFEGPAQLITTACAASSQALALGKIWIELGRVKRCLVVSWELLCQLTQRGFASFQLLSDKFAKPFDKNRSGINLSEGAAAVVLSSDKPENSLGELIGVGISADAHHMTAPHPEGAGCRVAMAKALKDADVLASEVDWIHAHGTGSIHNDLAESAAVASLFDDVPVSSTKGIHGHMLATSGILEFGLCLAALREQTIFGTAGLDELDDRISINIIKEKQKRRLNLVLKNTLGFGGANCSLLLSRPDR